jgi:predicted dehydrogenase
LDHFAKSCFQESALKIMNVGIIGCGAISGIYLYNCYRLRNLRPVALAARDPARVHAKIDEIQTRYNTDWKFTGTPQVPRPSSVADLLASPDVDLVMNLTVPKAHAEISLAALHAGKHLYSEKPLACSRSDAARILALAKEKNLRVGSAPDTFLGAGLQTCRKLLDDGWIGRPIGCTAFMTCPGHESWHPDPEFYYQAGGGPMWDMAPYYLTALVHLLGPVARISGAARATFPTRTITSAKKYGQIIPVETPTHIASTLEFANGAIGTMLLSFDVFGTNLPWIEIYGTAGSLSVPDPNTFGGDVRVKIGRGDWAPVPLTHGYRENSRGLGAADLAAGFFNGRPHRASAELAFHVVDVMQSSLEAARDGKTIAIQSTVERPAPLPMGLRDGDID